MLGRIAESRGGCAVHPDPQTPFRSPPPGGLIALPTRCFQIRWGWTVFVHATGYFSAHECSTSFYAPGRLSTAANTRGQSVPAIHSVLLEMRLVQACRDRRIQRGKRRNASLSDLSALSFARDAAHALERFWLLLEFLRQ